MDSYEITSDSVTVDGFESESDAYEMSDKIESIIG